MLRAAFVLTLLFVQTGEAADASLVAYSLREAEHRLKSGAKPERQLVKLGGATRLLGLVYDPDAEDVIVIGRAEEGGEALDLSDFVVAIRAVNVAKQWPLVSIDPTPQTLTSKKQAIRFEGGIINTSFGRALLDADIALKGLGIGTLRVKGEELPSYFDYRAALAKHRSLADEGSSRFWFYAVDPLLEQREDVFAIRDLKLGVRAQTVTSGSPTSTVAAHDEAADRFASALTKSYDKLSALIPEIARLHGLYEMVAMAQGIQSMPQANLTYWLEGYELPHVDTPQEFNYVVRQELIRTVNGIRTLEIGGGIQLKALAIRLQDGDITALKEAAVLSRPSDNSLSWRVPLDQWAIQNPGKPAHTAGESAADSDPGSSVSWRFVHQDQPTDGTGKPLYEPKAILQTDSPPNDPVFRAAPSDVIIVEPQVDGRYAIRLPGDADKPTQTTPLQKPSAQDTQSILTELERALKDMRPTLTELRVEGQTTSGMYHSSDGGRTYYLNGDSLEKLLSSTYPNDTNSGAYNGMYHTSDGGRTYYLNGDSLEKLLSSAYPSDTSSGANAAGTNHSSDGGQTDNPNQGPAQKSNNPTGPTPPSQSPGSGQSGFLCITASCLGSTQKTADGLTAQPYAYGDLNPYSVHRYFNAGWSVSDNGKVIATGFADVRLLGDRLFAAKDQWNGYGYRVYSADTHKPIHNEVFADVQSLGGSGYFAVPSSNGIGMTTIMDRTLKPLRSIPTYDLNNYVTSSQFQSDVTQRETELHPLSQDPPQPAPPASTQKGAVASPGQQVGNRGGIKADVKVHDDDFSHQ